MATLSENISQAIDDFDDIKDAIIAKGVSVPSGTPTSQYASKIGDIQTGITPSGTINILTNGTVDVTQYANANVNVSVDSTTLANLIQKTITSITVPSQVTQIGPYSFYECRALETVNMSNNIQYIDEYAFSYCLSIVNITFPSSLYVVGIWAFSNCFGLESVNFLNTLVTFLGGYCFYNCESLTTVYLPTTLSELGEYCFLDTALTDIYYAGTEAQWENNITIGQNAIPSGVTIHYNYSPT